MTTPRPPPVPSTASAGSNSTPKLPTLSTTVSTVPPWAKDEPPSPKDEHSSAPQLPNQSVSSDVVSFQSNSDHDARNAHGSLSRWWAFTLPRNAGRSPPDQDQPPQLNRKSSIFTKERTKSWLATPSLRDPPSSFSKHAKEKSSADTPPVDEHGGPSRKRKDWNLTISMPTPPRAPFTVAQTNSPGWETPWTSRAGAQGPFRSRPRNHVYGDDLDEEEVGESGTSGTLGANETTRWKSRKKRLRIFLLSNPYVPLLFRIINMSFTAGTLAVAVRIRQRESLYDVVGVVGSSPTLVIIFAPLTLLHVIGAIYLEYFGRPLGLWRTSAKLAHTLSEVLFICAWSAALSLCFDNYYTSLVPCAPPSSISWYNQLPRPHTNLPTVEGSVGDVICDSQLALICLVFVSLVMYCTNLVISLFRIFEKVKYLPGVPLGMRHR